MKPVNTRHAGLVFYSILAATQLWGCGESGKSTSLDEPECSSNEQCASRTDGKTECDTVNLVCVKPANEAECIKDSDCASRMDGKTECDTVNLVCITPATTPQCGNNKIESNESCDQNELDGKQCSDWPEFIGGTLTCSNLCFFDTSKCVECTETDKSKCRADQICNKGRCEDIDYVPECGNNIVDVSIGEECDGEALNGKTCAERPEFSGGKVSCKNDCTIDYSECISCLPGQEWSEKYNTCVYPISSKQDIVDLSDKWNSEGKAAYPTNDGKPTVFLLKNDIDMEELTSSTWTAIGTEANPFEAVFYGDEHTITATRNHSDGLWLYISHATIQDFTLHVDVSGKYEYEDDVNESLFAEHVDDSTIKNINISGKWNISFYCRDISGVFNYVKNSTLDDINIDLNTTVESISFQDTMALFAYTLESSTLNHISINGSFTQNENSHSVRFIGFAYHLDNSKLTNCDFDMDINTINNDLYRDDDICIISYKISNSSIIDKMNIKRASITKHNGDWGYLIRKFDYTCNKCFISNLEDNTTYNTTKLTYIIFEPEPIKTIVNSLFKGEVESFSFKSANDIIFVNDVFTSLPSLDEPPVLSQDVYFKTDVDDKIVTATKINNNLADKKANIPSGTYLPWKQDSDGQFYLDFNAKENELYVIP